MHGAFRADFVVVCVDARGGGREFDGHLWHFDFAAVRADGFRDGDLAGGVLRELRRILQPFLYLAFAGVGLFLVDGKRQIPVGPERFVEHEFAAFDVDVVVVDGDEHAVAAFMRVRRRHLEDGLVLHLPVAVFATVAGDAVA